MGTKKGRIYGKRRHSRGRHRRLGDLPQTDPPGSASAVRVRRLVLTKIGAMVCIDDNNLINKSRTKTICFKYWH